MTKQELLDLYFLNARSKLIDVAAFLDRVDRADGDADFRLPAFLKAVEALSAGNRVPGILTLLSDSTEEPVAAANVKSACGASPNA